MQIIQKKLQLSLSACSQICLGSNLHDSASNITITKIIYKNNCALADQSLICQRTLSNVDRCKNNVIYMSSMVQWWSTWNQSWWSEFTPARSPFVCSYRQDLPSLSSYRQDSPSFEFLPASVPIPAHWEWIHLLNLTWVSKGFWETKSEPKELVCLVIVYSSITY